MSRFRLTVLSLALCTLHAAAQQRPLKVYISVDMEGIAGVVTDDQLGPSGFEYERFREFMTAEALAAVQGAKDAGATSIVVSDSHGNGESLLIDKFPDDVMVVRSWPRPLGMMQGIDSSFSAAVFIGYHASTSNVAGVRAHTMSSATLTGIELNGVAMPESGINAAIAGQFGVPIVAISGDNVAVAEAQQLIGPMEGAVVKQAISFHAAQTMPPAAADALIRAKVKAGVAKRASLKPYMVTTPAKLDISFKNYRQAELLAYLPNVQRLTSHTDRYMAPNMVEVSKFIEFITNYQSGLAP